MQSDNEGRGYECDQQKQKKNSINEIQQTNYPKKKKGS